MIKPSDNSSNLKFGSVSAIDGGIVAFGSRIQKVFVYDISRVPAQELAILSSPDSTGGDNFGKDGVAVSIEYGILISAKGCTLYGSLRAKFSEV